MPLPCPCCRAANETPTCRRCQADLSLLFALEARRDYHITIAKRFAADGRVADARFHLQTAKQLRPGEDLIELELALKLLNRQFGEALTGYDSR